MVKGREFTKEQLLEAIGGTWGIMSAVAKRLECDWHTAEKYVNKWECTKRAFKDEGERVLDLGESKLVELVNEKDGPMIRYLLSTKGKHRGYTERKEITGAEGEPLVVKFVSNVDDEQL